VWVWSSPLKLKPQQAPGALATLGVDGGATSPARASQLQPTSKTGEIGAEELVGKDAVESVHTHQPVWCHVVEEEMVRNGGACFNRGEHD
jgi:hypothetical protein